MSFKNESFNDFSDLEKSILPSTKKEIEFVFKDMNPSELEELLIRFNYDLDATFLHLLSNLEVDGETIKNKPKQKIIKPETGAEIDTSKICRFYLAGNCYRKDCWFKHETKQTICQYYQKGFCSYGSECSFLHTDISEITNTLKLAAINKTLNTEKEVSKDDFPSLNTVEKFSINAWNTSNLKSVKNNRNAFNSLNAGKMEKITRIFSWVPENIILQYMASADYNESIVIPMLSKRFPKPINHKNKGSFKFGVNNAYKHIRRAPKSLPWIETGSNLNIQYMKHRRDAINHAVRRNKFLEDAKNAYLGGNSALAKKLSLEGQKHNKLMHEKHLEASQRIFDERNMQENISSINSKGKSVVIDLHCLHVGEAIEILKERVDILKKEKSKLNKEFYIITGTGHHSYSSTPKLIPAVVDWLKQRNFLEFWDCSVDNRGGVLVVKFID